MKIKIGPNIKVGQKILTETGWKTVLEVTSSGIRHSEGELPFGALVLGWKL